MTSPLVKNVKFQESSAQLIDEETIMNVDQVANNIKNEQIVETNWQLMPDADGNMHMVNLNDNESVEPTFNAWNQIRFILFTRSNRNGQQVALNNAGQLSASHFNSGHQTRFIIHGWNNDGNADVNRLISNAYLDIGNFNVFVVDWGAGANTINYNTARNRVGDVGHVTAQFIDFLHTRGSAFSSIVVIGHSLGAHAGGFAGKRVARGRIAAIVGLDPANPGFSIGAPAQRLHSGDANYVEVIHTDIGRLGFDQPIGHASFYPNWGRGHPGCGIEVTGMCSHSRAFEFFAESIRNSNGFWATRCSGWSAIQNRNCPSAGANQVMGGEPVNRGANGVFFLQTNPRPPFAQGWR